MVRSRSGRSGQGKVSQQALNNAGQQAFRFRFFSDTFAELRRVTWPAKEQVIRLSLMVLAISAVIGVFLASVDWIFSQITRLLLQINT